MGILLVLQSLVGARRYTLGGPTQQKDRVRCPMSQGVIKNEAKNQYFYGAIICALDKMSQKLMH